MRAPFVAAAVFAIGVALFAQDIGSMRPILSRVTPEYPDLAAKNHITGTVRVEAVISSDGDVVHTKVLGGNPILAIAAEKAVKQWKFRPQTAQSTEVIPIAFGGKP